MTRHLRGAAAVAGIATAIILGTGGPASAAQLCLNPPVPDMPGSGIAGMILPAPDHPSTGDPFASHPSATIYDVYGMAGYQFNVYDPGCAANVTNLPQEAASTVTVWFANQFMNVSVIVVSAVGLLLRLAFHPTYLSALDPVLRSVTSGLRDGFVVPWLPITVTAAALLIIAAAFRASLAHATKGAVWVLFVSALLSLIIGFPLLASTYLDPLISNVIGDVSGGISATSGGIEPLDASLDQVQRAVLYDTWLAGTFGRSNSATAVKYGPKLFAAETLTWAEAAQVEADTAAGSRGPGVITKGAVIVAEKEHDYKDVAAAIKAADPAAYNNLQGRSSSLPMVAGVGLCAALIVAPFLIMAAFLMIASYLIIRTAVMLFPVIGTIGVFPALRHLVVHVGEVVFSAVINTIIFATIGSLYLRIVAVLLAPGSGIPLLPALILILFFGIVMWAVAKPFRKLTRMVTSSRNLFAEGVEGPGGLAAATRRGVKTAMKVGAAAYGVNALHDIDEQVHKAEPSTPAAEPQPVYTQAERVYPEPTQPPGSVGYTAAPQQPALPLPAAGGEVDTTAAPSDIEGHLDRVDVGRPALPRGKDWNSPDPDWDAGEELGWLEIVDAEIVDDDDYIPGMM